MTVREAVYAGTSRLKERVETPFLDAVVLLCHAYGMRKEQLFAAYPDEVRNDAYMNFLKFIDYRLRGIPVSYIRGKKEFFGIDFYVDNRVLVPRPETELLVEKAIEIIAADNAGRAVHDCCTGTGCIAISLKVRYPATRVSASDISAPALEVFRKNCSHILGTEIPFCRSDLLSDVTGVFDIIVSNPPYLTTAEIRDLKSGGWPEPEVALDGGRNGLSLIDRLTRESAQRLKSGGYLLLEAAADQMSQIKRKLVQFGYQNIIISRDLAGKERVIKAQWKVS